jgi:hypothetical protein
VSGVVALQAGGFYAAELPDDTGIGWLYDVEARYRYAAGDGSVVRAELLWTSDDDPNIAGYGGVVTGNSYGLAGATWATRIFGFLGVILASVNIFGGFLVTERMLAMYKKKA